MLLGLFMINIKRESGMLTQGREHGTKSFESLSMPPSHGTVGNRVCHSNYFMFHKRGLRRWGNPNFWPNLLCRTHSVHPIDKLVHRQSILRKVPDKQCKSPTLSLVQAYNDLHMRVHNALHVTPLLRAMGAGRSLLHRRVLRTAWRLGYGGT